MENSSTQSVPENALAPGLDFRYVRLEPAARTRPIWGWGPPFIVLNGYAAHVLLGTLGAVLGVASAVGVVAIFSAMSRGETSRKSSSMVLLPWGVLVGADERVLRWSAIQSINVEMVHGRDAATPTTRWTLVYVQTDRDRLIGRASGAVSLERLVVHLERYAREQSVPVALDLEGTQAGDGPLEPDFEPLLRSARAYLQKGAVQAQLQLPVGGYRQAGLLTSSPHAIEVLRQVLEDRSLRSPDPRAFAAVVAAEIHATELTSSLVGLMYAPHPLLAAVARVAASRLTEGSSKIAKIDELAKFLADRDMENLYEWAKGS